MPHTEISRQVTRPLSRQAAAKMDSDDRKIRLELLRNRKKLRVLQPELEAPAPGISPPT